MATRIVDAAGNSFTEGSTARGHWCLGETIEGLIAKLAEKL